MDDEEIALPADTLAILNEFLAERTQREYDEEQRVVNKTGKSAQFEEDWQLSQFWYSEGTKRALGNVVTTLLDESRSLFHIALLSCPSLYATIKDIHEHVKIFEYDKRFAAYGNDFILYDFNNANTANYLAEYYNQFDLIIADPPFLSSECITKMSKIIKNLQRSGNKSKIIFCSGEIVEPWLTSCLPVHKCKFKPEHERNLGNEFVSYANFNLDMYFVNK